MFRSADFYGNEKNKAYHNYTNNTSWIACKRKEIQECQNRYQKFVWNTDGQKLWSDYSLNRNRFIIVLHSHLIFLENAFSSNLEVKP